MIDKNVEKKLGGAKFLSADITEKLGANYITLDFENEHGHTMRLTFVTEGAEKITTYVRKVPPLPTKGRGPRAR